MNYEDKIYSNYNLSSNYYNKIIYNYCIYNCIRIQWPGLSFPQFEVKQCECGQ